MGIAETDAFDPEFISKASKRCEEGGQVDQGGEGAGEPLVAQGQPAEPSLEPGEEALHRPLGYPVGGGAKAIGPTTPGPPPPPGVLRYAGPDAPPAQVTAHLPGMVGAVSAQLLWPPPGPAPPTPNRRPPICWLVRWHRGGWQGSGPRPEAGRAAPPGRAPCSPCASGSRPPLLPPPFPGLDGGGIHSHRPQP